MTTSSIKRIFIVDDSPVIHRGLTRLLETAQDLAVVGQASSAAEALEMIPSLELDLAIVDVGMAEMNGIALTHRLIEAHPELRVLILSIHDEAHYVEQALAAGADGYVLKDDAPGALRPAVRHVLAGGQFLSDSLRGLFDG